MNSWLVLVVALVFIGLVALVAAVVTWAVLAMLRPGRWGK